MSSIVTAVFKATIGLLVNKGRDKAAEKLKDGDVTDQKFRDLIVREIDDIKLKLDGLSRKDLKASMSFFKEGIELLYEVFDKARSRSNYGAVTAQAACAETFSLAREGMRNLTLTGLDESATRKLSKAKERFADARKEATRAFANEALETPDRILAMQYRVVATILETVDNPADAIAPCRVCIEEINCLPAIQKSFAVQLKKGIQAVMSGGFAGKEERRKIISSVYHVNRVIYDVMQAVGEGGPLLLWPTVDTGEGKVYPLLDERVTKVLRKQGMDPCCVRVTSWSFGQEGEEEHKLKKPQGITTNSNGQFIVVDIEDRNVNVFDSSGKYVNNLSLTADDVKRKFEEIADVATDMNDNIYVLVGVRRPGDESYEYVVLVFNETAGLHHEFSVKGDLRYRARLTILDNGKVLVLTTSAGNAIVHMYETDGQFVRSFGEGILKCAWGITAVNDGRVMVLDRDLSSGDYYVHLFSEQGNNLNKFEVKLEGGYLSRIAFHRPSEHVVVATGVAGRLQLQIFTKDGEFVRITQINEEGFYSLRGMTVTTEGRIAVVFVNSDYENGKVLVV